MKKAFLAVLALVAISFVVSSSAYANDEHPHDGDKEAHDEHKDEHKH